MARTPTESDVSSEECVTLVLQGGGVLGAYQAGAYEGLAKQARDVSWVAGISIGSINAAI
jgi:NTE family protein